MMAAQQSALLGLTAIITGHELQDDIAHALKTCYHRGQRLIRNTPWPIGGKTVEHWQALFMEDGAEDAGGCLEGKWRQRYDDKEEQQSFGWFNELVEASRQTGYRTSQSVA
jgi:hypothetical protein